MNYRLKHFIIITCILKLASCSPSVRISTPEPVKIDVAMSVDVHNYHHLDESTSGEFDDPNSLSPHKRRRNRMAEVQNLKNDRVIGEGNDGLLHIRKTIEDKAYKDYTDQVVALENADRMEIFARHSKEFKKPKTIIIKESVQRSRDASFPGEWVQMDDDTWQQQ